MSTAPKPVEPLIVLPGPWPGHPQPFKHLRVYGCGVDLHDCSSCPKSMLCLAGKKLFKDEELQGNPNKPGGRKYTRFSICAHCEALIWFDPWHHEAVKDTVHICYVLGQGQWARPGWDGMTVFGKHSLSLILMAAIGKSDLDLVSRFFRRDTLCKYYERTGVVNCAQLYRRFLQQRAYLPDEIQDGAWLDHG